MGVRTPGSRSNLTLLSSAGLAIIALAILIGGHVILIYLIYSSMFGHGSMKNIMTSSGMPGWLLWLVVLGAIAMDAWIFYSIRRDRKKANER